GLTPACLGPKFALLGALLGGACPKVRLAAKLLRRGDRGRVALRLLALGLLAPLGDLELQRLQVLVALVARVREHLGCLGPLLLGLPSRLRAQLRDLPLGGRT